MSIFDNEEFSKKIPDYLKVRLEGKKLILYGGPENKEWSEEYKWKILPPLNKEFIKGGFTKDNILEKVTLLQKPKNNPNFVNFRSLDDLKKVTEKNPSKTAELFNTLLYSKNQLAEKIDIFIKETRKIKKDAKLGTPLSGYIFAAFDCNAYPLYKDEIFKYVKKVIGTKKEWQSYSIGEKYEKFRELCLEVGKYFKEKSLLKEVAVNGIKIIPGYEALDGQDFLYVSMFIEGSVVKNQLPLIFKVSQGQGADSKNYTEYSVKNNKLILGWLENFGQREVDKLNQLNQEENFKRFLIDNSISALTAKKCWDFKQAPTGTIAIANKGKGGILAIGNITESKIYYSENDLPNRPDKGNLNYKKINWVITIQVKGKNIFEEINTIEQVDADQWQKIKELYFKTYPDEKDELKNKFNILENNINNMQQKNLILYGPPGTGKTYIAMKMAEELLSSQTKVETEEERVGKIIKELTWLDIIGVIMRLRGEGKYRVPELTSDIIAKAVAKLKNRTSKLNPTFWGLMQLHSNETSETVKLAKRSGYNLFDKDEQSMWYLTDTGKEYFADDRYNEIIKQLGNTKAGKKDWKEYYDFITFHQSYSYEEFIEGIRPVLDDEEDGVRYELKDGVFKRMCRKAEQDPNNNYLLIIDEINRGNISKIFGELLTLVEEDKRSGGKNQITVILPYSGQEFCVPANLYILGTMNTADRSIALLDVALRRRFKFKELMPEYNETGLNDIKIDDLNVGHLLKKINEKINIMIDRDHQIGHSYFLKLNKAENKKELLHSIWYDEIIPLFQEYFYNDWEKIGHILGKYNSEQNIGFVEVKSENYIRGLFEGDNGDEYSDVVTGSIHKYDSNQLLKALTSL